MLFLICLNLLAVQENESTERLSRAGWVTLRDVKREVTLGFRGSKMLFTVTSHLTLNKKVTLKGSVEMHTLT